MVLLAAVLLIGAIWGRTKKFWAYGVGALIVQNATVFLFYGGGTLEDPSRDGLITAIVRQVTDDGSLVGLLIFPAMLFGWVVPILLIIKGIRPFRSSLPKSQET